MNMNRKIIFSIFASFSSFSCFGAAEVPQKGILKKTLFVTSVQAEDMGQRYAASEREGVEIVAKFKNAVKQLLNNHSYSSIVMVGVVGRISAIPLNVEDREKALSYQAMFERGIGGVRSDRTIQQFELGFQDLGAFQKAFYPILVKHLQDED